MDRLSQSPELNLIKIRAARADKNLSSAYIYTYIYIHNYSHTPPRRNRRKGNASRGGNAAVCPITYPTVITAKRINPQLPFRYPSKREGAFFRVFELIEPMGGGRSSRRIRERRKEPNIGRKKERESERGRTRRLYTQTPRLRRNLALLEKSARYPRYSQKNSRQRDCVPRIPRDSPASKVEYAAE